MASDARSDGGGGELDDAPPFLTWRAIYFIVLAALAANIVLGAALTARYG